MLKQCKLYASPHGSLGLHLSRAPWDPYPWVSEVQAGSSAECAGVRNGDTVLEMNGRDVLGQKIAQIAEQIGKHWQSGASYVSVVIWRNQAEDGEEEAEATDENDENQKEATSVKHSQHHSINQQSLQKFATCLQQIAQLLECPVCLEVTRPPGWQCCNGHVLCNNCRSRSVKCPVCRVPLGPRGRCLLSDKLFNVLAENFPCDGVKQSHKSSNRGSSSSSNNNSNNNSPPAIRKCNNTDLHKQPKMTANPKENCSSTRLKKSKQEQQQEEPHESNELVAEKVLLAAVRATDALNNTTNADNMLLLQRISSAGRATWSRNRSSNIHQLKEFQAATAQKDEALGAAATSSQQQQLQQQQM